MIIHSIRLKNIKSFGEGADGGGVVVHFQPGVNRIAGKNGHGKTTLIESIGCALFMADPQHEEWFDVSSYFLRNGCKTGEIDVTFTHNDQTYRVERGLGSQNRRRDKVIDIADQSVCAEGNQEVERFLCELFGFPSKSRLSDLFTKLVGVQQGRLTLPFDSKPGESKRFFEPLLEVDIFRRCFDELKPALDRIKTLKHDQEVRLAGIETKIHDRADSPEKLTRCRDNVSSLRELLRKDREAWEAAGKIRDELEQKEKAVREAATARDRAKNAADLAAREKKIASERLEESKTAANRVAAYRPAHEAFIAAEAALKTLREREKARANLEKKKTEVEKLRLSFEEKAGAAAALAATLSGQRESKNQELAEVRQRIKSIEEVLHKSAEAHEQAELAGKDLAEQQEKLRLFFHLLERSRPEWEVGLKKILDLSAELATWNADDLAAAAEKQRESEKLLQKLRDQRARVEERKAALDSQLKQIGGGICPFLKEQCRQFEPEKVRSDSAGLSDQIKSLEEQIHAAEQAHDAANQMLQTLTARDNQLKLKRSQLGELINHHLHALRTIVSPFIISAAGRAVTLLPGNQDTLPTAPVAPEKVDEIRSLVAVHQEFSVFFDRAAAWWNALNEKINGQLTALEEATSRRQKDVNTLEACESRAAGLNDEITILAKQETASREEAARLSAESMKAAGEIAMIEQQLSQYSDVAQAIADHESLLQRHRKAHESFIADNPVASLLTERQAVLTEKSKTEEALIGELKRREQALAEAMSGFDPNQLAAARKDYEEKSGVVTTRQNDLKHAEDALKAEEKRFEELERARLEKKRADAEIARLSAAIDLGELARNILLKSAPAVAQRLCTQIATSAQRIFNQINHDPVELKWNASTYSLRITPGDRRFAMLSGGEQTKLAVAMTLAMARQFSNLRFCIFDEPTYGVDAESRSILAEAILDAQRAAHLEQLLLVSHDEAFEGKTEHTILLEKSASGGSRVVFAQ